MDVEKYKLVIGPKGLGIWREGQKCQGGTGGRWSNYSVPTPAKCPSCISIVDWTKRMLVGADVWMPVDHDIPMPEPTDALLAAIVGKLVDGFGHFCDVTFGSEAEGYFCTIRPPEGEEIEAISTTSPVEAAICAYADYLLVKKEIK